MGDSQLKPVPNNVENTRKTAIESVGEAAGKAAREASLKLSTEGNPIPDSGTHKKSDASTPNTLDSFFNGDSSKGKRITVDDVRELEKSQQSDNTAKKAPPDVMKAIEEEKLRIKSAVKDVGDGASDAAKNQPTDSAARKAPPDVMRAIEEEKLRIGIRNAGEAASAAVKNLPDLQIK